MRVAHLLLPLLAQAAFSPQFLSPLDSEELQDSITQEELEHHANVLYNISQKSVSEFGNPTRVIGSAGHYGTVGHILDTLHKYSWYYKVWVQPFNAVISKIESCKLLVDGKEPALYEGFSLTPPTRNNGDFVNGTLIEIEANGCADSDYAYLSSLSSENEQTDYVALIRRGECPFERKSHLAAVYGAQAAIIYDNEYNDEALLGTLGEPTEEVVPTVGITRKQAELYISELQSRKLDVAVAIDSYVKNVTTNNVIAETRLGDKNNIVMAGSHTDSVPTGPGINDDGSGTISLLVLAKYLTKYAPKNTIRLGFWAAEEEGLLGLTHYVKQLLPSESARHRLFLDYDMMASPNYAYQVYDGNNVDNPAGSEEIKQLYIDWYKSHGLNYTLVPFDGRSDYAAFIENGIPGGGIATGAEGVKTEEEVEMFGGTAGKWYDLCYHQLCDDLGNVDYEAWVYNTKLIAHSVATYGASLEGFPEKAVELAGTRTFKYKGDFLIL